MILTKETILEKAKKEERIKSIEIAKTFKVSRQYVNRLILELVENRKLIKIGSTRSAFYVLPEFASKHLEIFPKKITKILSNVNLEEHKVLDEIENNFPSVLKLKENVRDIFTYAFSEMLNNAIEHSQSKSIEVDVSIEKDLLVFRVNDSGVGVFYNIMQQRKLNSELEAIQDLLKGKTTTMPKSHSGEGIFFTSKAGELFILESHGYRLIINNKVNDIFLEELPKKKKGTKVIFKIAVDVTGHLSDVFKKYTNQDSDSDYGFDKTEIKIKLYTKGGIHVSRSQARRVLSELEKFKVIIFDFDKVPMVGQAFADEIFRVFHEKYPEITIQAINMNEAVRFMVDRVEGNNPRNPDLFGKPE